MKGELPEKRPEGFPGQRLVIIPPNITLQASRAPITRDLSVTHIGTFTGARGHHVERPNGTSQHILIACLSGRGSCTVGGQEWTLEPGNLLFLPPREHHLYQSDPNAPWTIFWMHFRGLRAEDYLTSLGVSGALPVVAVDDVNMLREAFEDTFRHATHGYNEAAMTGISTAFSRLLGLVKVHQRTPSSRSRQVEDRLLKVLAKMRGDLAYPWTLEALARESHLSIPHFTELCRRQTGMPPLGLLIRLRLQRAMDLLQQRTHNVTEAALAVGYEDPFYFSRLFRKHMGIAPSSCLHGP